MNYKEYRKEHTNYLQAKEVLNEVIEEYSVAFQKTQPHSPIYSDIQMSGFLNRTEEYVIEIERKNLKHRAKVAEMVLESKKYLLDLKEAELRKSLDIYDLVYVAKWIDQKATKDIVRELDSKGIFYSKSQVYAIIKRIKSETERA